MRTPANRRLLAACYNATCNDRDGAKQYGPQREPPGQQRLSSRIGEHGSDHFGEGRFGRICGAQGVVELNAVSYHELERFNVHSDEINAGCQELSLEFGPAADVSRVSRSQFG